MKRKIEFCHEFGSMPINDGRLTPHKNLIICYYERGDIISRHYNSENDKAQVQTFTFDFDYSIFSGQTIDQFLSWFVENKVHPRT